MPKKHTVLTALYCFADGGIKLRGDQKDEIDSLLDKLAEAGRGSRPLKSPLLMGDYEVAYTSTQRAGTQNGQPSGGRFRGAIGRMLFQTTGLFQSILPGDSAPVAVNKVCTKTLTLHDPLEVDLEPNLFKRSTGCLQAFWFRSWLRWTARNGRACRRSR